jgi:hypothetical protein
MSASQVPARVTRALHATGGPLTTRQVADMVGATEVAVRYVLATLVHVGACSCTYDPVRARWLYQAARVPA